MKIIQVSPRFHPAVGGLEKHVYLLSKELVRRGHEVKVYTTTSLTSEDVPQLYMKPPFINSRGKAAQSPRETVNDGILVKRLKSLFRFWSLLIVPELPLRLFMEDVEIFHIHGYQPFTSICSALAVKIKDYKNRVVLTTHDIQIAESLPHYCHFLLNLYNRTIGKLLLKLSDVIIVLNEADKKTLTKMGVNLKKLVCIPNSIDTSFLDPRNVKLEDVDRFREKHRLKEHVVLIVGRLERRKRIDLLILAFKKVIDSFDNCSLLIVGPDYGEFQHLMQLSLELQLLNYVVFTGVLSDEELLRAFVAADVLVSTSEQEAFGITLIEAMAMEVPVVASAWKGMKYVVRHGENGFLIKPGDVGALSQCILQILSDEELNERMGKNGREHVKKFSVGKMTDHIEELYTGALSFPGSKLSSFMGFFNHKSSMLEE